jgi:hypothetical protein
MQKFTLQLATLAGALVLSLNASAHNKNNFSVAMSKPTSIQNEVQTLSQQAPKLKTNVLKLALTAFYNAQHMGFDHRQILTVIDYNMPDYQKRLWVFNLKTHHVLYNTYVAHGKSSGNVYANHFSNRGGTHASSIGLFLTKNTYFGGKGLSLRLAGLDRGFNDNALRRNIVMHGAWYVSSAFAKEYGRIGESWGCPALSRQVAKPIINTIKNGTLVFAYASDYSWLHASRFLRSA